MKQSTSFRLSEEALRLLEEQSKERGLSQASWLEVLLREHTPSDRHEGSRRRKQAWLDYEKKHAHYDEHGLRDFARDFEGVTPENIWRDGFSTGWMQFQTRHQRKP